MVWLLLLLWFLLSVPVGVLLGRGIAAGRDALVAADIAQRAAQGSPHQARCRLPVGSAG